MKSILLAATAVAIAAVSVGPADAAKRKVQVPNRFDGNWSIEVVTLDGPCDRAYRYGVQIYRGEAIYPGGDVSIRGRVASSGAVTGVISRGSNGAQVAGRLRLQGNGGGTWTSVGNSLIACSGRWNATRRS